MPKEIVECPNAHVGGPEAPGVFVAVGWSKDPGGDAQIGVCQHGHAPGDPAGGWFASLDRYRINELIRLLRKARDGAFGRDE